MVDPVPAPAATPTPAVAPPAAPATPPVPTPAAAPAPAPAAAPIPAAAPAAVPPPAPATILGAETAPAATPPAPIDYGTLKYGEGFQAPQGDLGKGMTELFQANNLPPDKAQAFIDYGQKLVKHTQDNVLQTNQKIFNDSITAFQTKAKADPVLMDGGQNIEPAVAKINGLMAKFGEPGLKAALWPASDNPLTLRFLYKMAKALGEGGPVAPGTPPSVPKSASATLYGGKPQ